MITSFVPGKLYKLNDDGITLFDFYANMNKTATVLECMLKRTIRKTEVVACVRVEPVTNHDGEIYDKLSFLLGDGVLGTLWNLGQVCYLFEEVEE